MAVTLSELAPGGDIALFNFVNGYPGEADKASFVARPMYAKARRPDDRAGTYFFGRSKAF